jgi:hypothetical protein
MASMLQNRVKPTGEIVADPRRGLMLGNRGCLHGQGRELGVSRWRSKLWICCVLEWKGVRRDPMPPGRWTALFFLDEATALAAGHRPCGYCRRGDYLAFATAWQAARSLAVRPHAVEMDAQLHAERIDRPRRQRTHIRPAADLPDGVMVRYGADAALLVGGQPRIWSFDGYGGHQLSPARASPAPALPARAWPAGGTCEVLTPPSIVAAIGAGYRPMVHPSALAGTRAQLRRQS